LETPENSHPVIGQSDRSSLRLSVAIQRSLPAGEYDAGSVFWFHVVDISSLAWHPGWRVYCTFHESFFGA
jgi:hypothetical protein